MSLHRMSYLPLRCLVVAVASIGCFTFATDPRDTMPDTWAATDALGAGAAKERAKLARRKPNRTVGIFYFNWHAAFGNHGRP
jgi:hypothetical protein